MTDAMQRAIDAVGGKAALARIIGISRQAITQWDHIPAERVIDVERACGGAVRREELRPDIYPPPTESDAA